jgi:HEAT repeat protein
MSLMPRLLLLSLLLLAIPARSAASPHILFCPPAESLGWLSRECTAIHLLQVVAVTPERVSFKVVKALKGTPRDVAFLEMAFIHEFGQKGLFHVGDAVVCFRDRASEYEGLDRTVRLHVGGRWTTAASPSLIRGEKDWLCWAEADYSASYCGTAEKLCEAVEAVLAGREITVLAREPRGWSGGNEPGRLWRVRAGMKVKSLVPHDESPHFVGWGTGESDELAVLERALRDRSDDRRVEAVADLAYLGAEARPALRRALDDPVPAVSMAAAKALAKIDPDDREAGDFLKARLRDSLAEVRAAAAATLGNIGVDVKMAVPALLETLKHEDYVIVRQTAARAIRKVRPAPRPELVSALSALLKTETDAVVRDEIIQVLWRFGGEAWAALPVLYRAGFGWDTKCDPGASALVLMAHFDPPPVELLAQVLADPRASDLARGRAVEGLVRSGMRAAPALPVLRRLFLDGESEDDAQNRPWLRGEIVDTILAADPDEGPALVHAAALEMVKRPPRFDHNRLKAVRRYALCGKAAGLSVVEALAELDPHSSDTASGLQLLLPLLHPGDARAAAEVRRVIAGMEDRFDQADLLVAVGQRDEALQNISLCLKSDEEYNRIRAIRWLAKEGRAARALEPVVREALARTAGVEHFRITTSLRRMSGAEGDDVYSQARTAIEALVDRCGYVFKDDAVTFLALNDRLQSAADPAAELTAALRDSDPVVRLAAASALARITPLHPDVVPTLKKLLERHPMYFHRVEETLTRLGPAAASIGPVVERISRQTNDHGYPHEFDDAYNRVLRRIDPARALPAWTAASASGAVPQDLGRLWEDLLSADPFVADLAVWRLAGSGRRGVDLIRDRVQPPTPLPAERIDRLLADLDSEDFAVRERAEAELLRDIESAIPTLRKALTGTLSPEQRRRVTRLVTLADPTSEPEQQRRLRAIRILGAMDIPEAADVLKRLAAGDPRFALTRAAAAALKRSPAAD